MELGSIPSATAMLPGPARTNGAEKVAEKRREASSAMDEPVRVSKKIASEEILSKIKDLTDDGVYSVRFERNEEKIGRASCRERV